MRQSSSSVSPRSSSGLDYVLHPVLQAALDALDVELEEELARYRRQAYLQARQVGHQPTGRKRSPVSAGLFPEQAQTKARSKSKKTAELQLPLTESSSGSSGLPGSKRLAAVGADLESSEPQVDPGAGRSQEPVARLSAPQYPLQEAAPPQVNSIPNPASRDSIALSGAMEKYGNPKIEGDKNIENIAEQEPITDVWDEVALLAAETNSPDEELTQSDGLETPDGYLESTEELLKSIAEEPLDLRAEREGSLLDSLLTPLGIGSMLLLLLSSATLGYVIMNPTSLTVLLAQKSDDSSATQPLANEMAESPAPGIPDSPNLAAEEFVDLNLDTLSTLPGRSSPTPNASSPTLATPPANVSPEQASGSTQAAGESAIPANPTIAAAPVPVEANPPVPVYEPEPPAEPIEPYNDPAPEPVNVDPLPPEPSEPSVSVAEPAPPEIATAPAASPAPGNYYYVVTPYSGDPSLEQAREVVPDAYVRNFEEAGANVQMGAFSDPTQAEELLQQLEEQGISAEIYQP